MWKSEKGKEATIHAMLVALKSMTGCQDIIDEIEASTHADFHRNYRGLGEDDDDQISAKNCSLDVESTYSRPIPPTSMDSGLNSGSDDTEEAVGGSGFDSFIELFLLMTLHSLTTHFSLKEDSVLIMEIP